MLAGEEVYVQVIHALREAASCPCACRVYTVCFVGERGTCGYMQVLMPMAQEIQTLQPIPFSRTCAHQYTPNSFTSHPHLYSSIQLQPPQLHDDLRMKIQEQFQAEFGWKGKRKIKEARKNRAATGVLDGKPYLRSAVLPLKGRQTNPSWAAWERTANSWAPATSGAKAAGVRLSVLGALQHARKAGDGRGGVYDN